MSFSRLNSTVLRFVIIYVWVLFVIAEESSRTDYAVPGEIEKLFNSVNRTSRQRVKTSTDGGSKIFAEGVSNVASTDLFETHKKLKNSSEPGKENFTSTELKTSKSESARLRSNKTSSSQVNESHSKIILPTLNESSLGLIPDMYEFAHVNGTSSIKPRKGVDFNTVVPGKGSIIEDFLNHTLPSGHACFVADQNKCYYVENIAQVECTCCNISNKLGQLVKTKASVDCNTCTSITSNVVNVSHSCADICCKNISKSVMSVNTQNISKINAVLGSIENESNTLSAIKTAEKDQVVNLLIKKKLKPTVTHVPSDSEAGSNPFSKNKGEKYVPIIVSIFLLPLIGIFVYFMWKKTRELWDRRYYKRMDFLIDGIYND